MVTTAYTREELLDFLSEIADPEIPVVSIQEIGMLRDVRPTGQGWEVVLTSTYTGCPAMGIIEADIKALLRQKGVDDVAVRMVYHPAWTTDWITEEAKQKMLLYGIAPPAGCAAKEHKQVACPRCMSTDTVVVTRFGATACKALYKCNNCKEPFEYFKCH